MEKTTDPIILSDAERIAVLHFAGEVARLVDILYGCSTEAKRIEYEGKIIDCYKDHIARLRTIRKLEKEDREKILKMAIESGMPLYKSLPMVENYYKNGNLPEQVSQETIDPAKELSTLNYYLEHEKDNVQ